MPRKHRVVSAIQPTGIPTLGNYIGAIRQWEPLSREFEAFYSIVDLHALTSHPHNLSEDTQTIAAILLSINLDPEHCTLFMQSHVPEHSELCWILTSFTMVGELTRMTQFKDKSSHTAAEVNAGLFSYPILMAADILLYKADIVPVGIDQNQHLELTRTIARRINQRINTSLPEPAAKQSLHPKLLGIDGKAKMSKSLNNHIGILDTKEEIFEKLKKTVTDPARIRRNDAGNPQNCPVIYPLHKAFSSQDTIEDIHDQCQKATIGCMDCKKKLGENIITELRPIQDAFYSWKAKPKHITEIFDKGAQHAQKVAQETLGEIREKIGLLPRS